MLMIKVEFFKASMFGELALKLIHTSAEYVNCSQIEMILKEFWFKFKYLSSCQKHNNREQELRRWTISTLTLTSSYAPPVDVISIIIAIVETTMYLFIHSYKVDINSAMKPKHILWHV